MINVAIVEDEDSQVQVLYEYIERYSHESGSKYSYKRFRDGYEFIENYRQEFGVVLLDINMPHLNGMDAAVMLREKDKNVSIVFITSLVQFALRGYEVDAVSFMKKEEDLMDTEHRVLSAEFLTEQYLVDLISVQPGRAFRRCHHTRSPPSAWPLRSIPARRW